MNARMLFLLLTLAALLPAPATAFEIYGYRSGMSQKAVTKHTAALGLDSWLGPSGTLSVGNERAGRMDVTLGFCEDILISYRRQIASDVEYLGTLNAFGVRYGSPSTVKVLGGGEWSERGGVAFQSSFVMIWYRGDDRITLTAYPEGQMEWREGMGNFRHARPPSLDIVTRNPCGV